MAKFRDPGRVADEAKFLNEKVPSIKELNKAGAKDPKHLKQMQQKKKKTCPGCTTPQTCKAQGRCRISGRAL